MAMRHVACTHAILTPPVRGEGRGAGAKPRLLPSAPRAGGGEGMKARREAPRLPLSTPVVRGEGEARSASPTPFRPWVARTRRSALWLVPGTMVYASRWGRGAERFDPPPGACEDEARALRLASIQSLYHPQGFPLQEDRDEREACGIPRVLKRDQRCAP